MSVGRTVAKYSRVYADGYDLSGSARTIGPLGWTFEEHEFVGLSSAVKGILPGQAIISAGTLNTILDTTTALDIHAALKTSGAKRTLMIPIGIRAAPAAGDPVFAGQFNQKQYISDITGDIVTINVPFESWPTDGTTLSYKRPWGTLLHANGAETGANTSTGIDDYGAATSEGGFMVYQIFAVAGEGTVTVKVQEASTNENGSFGDLTSATSGAIAHGSVPAAGLVACSTAASIKRYLRWQLALSGITSATFALGFVRVI